MLSWPLPFAAPVLLLPPAAVAASTTGFTVPAGTGFAESTIPCAGGAAVLGVATESSGTEFVVGISDAVGVVLFGLPSGLFIGAGTLGGPPG